MKRIGLPFQPFPKATEKTDRVFMGVFIPFIMNPRKTITRITNHSFHLPLLLVLVRFLLPLILVLVRFLFLLLDF